MRLLGSLWRFGHGTGSGADAGSGRVLSPEDVADVVVRGAAAFLTGARRQAFDRFVDGGGAKLLADAVPVWAAASGEDEAGFRAAVVGSRARAGVARAVQAVGREVDEARGPEGLRAASAALALAVKEGGPEWRYELRSARDQAVYAAASGQVAATKDAAPGVFVAGAVTGAPALGAAGTADPRQIQRDRGTTGRTCRHPRCPGAGKGRGQVAYAIRRQPVAEQVFVGVFGPAVRRVFDGMFLTGRWS